MTMKTDGNRTIRRVVTGLDAHGRGVVVHDGEPPNRVLLAGDTVAVDVWQTDGPVRTPLDGGDDCGAPAAFAPRGGIAWKMGMLPAHSATNSQHGETQTKVDEAEADRRVSFVENDREHPGRHRSETLDFVLVIEGDIYLVLEEDPNLTEVHLTAGDCVVQRGVWHRWENRGATPCVLSTVMVTVLDERS